MLVNKLTGLALLGLLGWASAASAQGLGNSPYSRLGLGDVNMNTGGIRQQGMGGSGLASPNSAQVNELNPALLYYTNRTTYEVAAIGQLKRLSNGSASQVDGGATLNYLAFAVPISRRWAAAAGLKQFSTVDYTSQSLTGITGDPNSQVLKKYTGTGGLSEVYLGQGVRITKGLSLGLTASYIFGTVDQTSLATVAAGSQTSLSLNSSSVNDHTQYSDFVFRAGAHYRQKLSEKLNGSLGAVHTFGTDLTGYRQTQAARVDPSSGIAIETIELASNKQGFAVLPANTQLGLSLDNGRNWTFSADVARQQWSKFREFRYEADAQTGQLYDDTWRAAAGGEWVPDPTSVDNYFKRVAYRFGLSVASLPYRPGGQTTYDRAVSWGFTFPFPTSSPFEATNMNLSFTYGQRGNTDPALVNGVNQRNIKEDYMRVQLGVSLNNRWFLKRKVE